MTHIWIEPSANRIASPTIVSGIKDDEQIVIKDSVNQQWLLVAADTETCLFEAVEAREIGNSPRTRTMPLKQVQELFGWGKPKNDPYVRPSLDFDGMGIEVYTGRESLGYALAEPVWYKRVDDPVYVVSAWMDRLLAIDCDRAANFAMREVI